MADPSSNVAPGLLRHIHLVSTYNFPKLPHFNLDVVVEYLLQAPRIVKEQAAMNWRFLQCPQDGEVLLVWQPPHMGTREASDGYVWIDPEQAFSSEMRGYKVEMYVHRTGFSLPNEPVATHARRRLRLTPSQNPDSSVPPSDSSLWIIHYCQTEQQNQFPSRGFRIPEQMRHMMHERVQLQSRGQPIRKEFMLRDSASWPTVNLPGNPNASHPQQAMGYPNDVMAHMNRSQQQAYMQQQQQQATAAQRGIGPSPSKRPRHSNLSQSHGSATAIPAPVMPQDTVNDDEDGTVGGDYMDYLTPRDISLHRYIQHHQWLEQILESPYDTNQIVPGDLGLGRKGELESLTKDFFDAPTDGTPQAKFPIEGPVSGEKDSSAAPPLVGRLPPGQAEDFSKRATEKVAQINSEMEKLKRQHARRMAKLQKLHSLKEAETKLRLETLEIMNGDPMKLETRQDGAINDVAVNVFGKGIRHLQDVECLEKGGLEETSKGETLQKGIPKENFVDPLGDSLNLEHKDDMGHSMLETTSAEQEALQGVWDMVEDHQPPNPVTSAPEDIRTQKADPETSNSSENQENLGQTHTVTPKDQAAEDWTIINKDGETAQEDQNADLADLDSFVNDAAMQSSVPTPDAVHDHTSAPPQDYEQATENTASEAFEQNTQGDQHGDDFETNMFGEGIDFGDMDTAGDELSSLAQANDTAEISENVDMGTSDGAFGDAFPAAETNSGNEAS